MPHALWSRSAKAVIVRHRSGLSRGGLPCTSKTHELLADVKSTLLFFASSFGIHSWRRFELRDHARISLTKPRFKDGSIVEAVVWKGKGAQRHRVVEQARLFRLCVRPRACSSVFESKHLRIELIPYANKNACGGAASHADIGLAMSMSTKNG